MVAPISERSPEAKLHLAIVGLGKMGHRHWRTWRRFSGADITAVVDTDSQAALWAQEQGIAFFRDTAELVGRVDAAVIATPAARHVSSALPLLDAGIHCLVEKPIAIELADGERLVASAARHGALLAIGHSERFNPGVQRAREATACALERIEV
ncbi:MAG: Gfo/Idh/MocA family oxidoreductase, partial [Ramlibacter sp.]|nr:Gfo/Idh/MocA family oxidoreductase [Ramlibacter sp.]